MNMKYINIVVLLLSAAADGTLFEGDKCDKDGTSGVCTKLSRCPTARDDTENRSSAQKCGSSSVEPIVCCVPSGTPGLTTTDRPRSTTTEYIPPPVEDYVEVGEKSGDGCKPIQPALAANRTARKAWNKCVEYQEQLVFPCSRSTALGGERSRHDRCHHNADELIVGGTDAALYEFPHMALLGYGGNASDLQWLCGGSLISETFVLTAGHCISSVVFGPVTYVALDILRRGDVIGDQNRFKVKEIIKHPEYNPPHKYHDIALLKLTRTVSLSEFVVPACLHVGDTIDDGRASTAGWGNTKYNGNRSDVLQKVILTKFNSSECAMKFSPHRHMINGFDDETQICYGDRTQSKDTCQGDSGGPLQVKSKKISCMYTVVGVTSFGKACGFIGDPGIYTRVAHYLDWIEANVWP